MDWLEHISHFWPHLVAGFDFLAALLASIHALLHKRDSRAATLWLGLIWHLSLISAILSFSLGVHRIRRRAITLGVRNTITRTTPENLGEPEHAGAEHLKMLARVVGHVVERPSCPAIKSSRSSTATRPFRRCSRRLKPPKNPSRSRPIFLITTKAEINLSPRLKRRSNAASKCVYSLTPPARATHGRPSPTN